MPPLASRLPQPALEAPAAGRAGAWCCRKWCWAGLELWGQALFGGPPGQEAGHPMAAGATPLARTGPVQVCSGLARLKTSPWGPCDGAGAGIARCWSRARLRPWVIGASAAVYKTKTALTCRCCCPVAWPRWAGLAWAYLQLGLGLGLGALFACTPAWACCTWGQRPSYGPSARCGWVELPCASPPLGRLTRASLDLFLSSTSDSIGALLALAVHLPGPLSNTGTVDDCDLQI